MAQISYGTITITDTNDIESIVVEYARNQDPSNAPSSGWSTTRPAWAQGYYIWQRTRTHKAGTETSEDTYGTAVCITGSTGATGAAGRSLSSTVTHYTIATSSATINQSNMGSYTWTTNVPSYNASYPTYWVRVTNTYSNPSSTEYIFYKDQGITDAVKTSHDANTTAEQAKTAADEAKEIAQQTSTDVTNLQIRTKYFWTNLTAHTNGTSGWTKPDYPVGTYAASGISGTTFDSENSNTYGYNTLYSNGIKLRYNAINLGELTGTALTFYHPSTSSQGAKAMELGATALKFYDATGSIVQAEFGGTQAKISGTINAYDGKIGNNNSNYWYIGNYTDYNQNDSAIIKSIGTASIQLNETNTWRVATNRIHTAWAPSTGTDAFKLHFPIFNDSNSNSKHWDYGLHLPTSKDDKFLYIRNAASTQTLDNLLNDLEDSGYNYWTYKFYVDGEGNLHAGDIYSHDTLISGTSAPYLLKSGGTMTGSITMSNGGKLIGDVTGNVSGSAGKLSNTSIIGNTNKPVYFTANGVPAAISYEINKSVPSDAVFTDKNVQTTKANTTKIYLTGTQTNGTNTGTLNFDEYVSVGTTAGALYATTFNGYTLAAAAAKGVDTSMTSTSTSTNLPTTKAVADLIATYLPLAGGTVSGAVDINDELYADSATFGNLIVNDVGRFTNGIYGDLIGSVTGNITGNASTADKVNNNLIIKLASGTTEGTNMFTFNGYAAKTVDVTKSAIGLGNVENKSSATIRGELTSDNVITALGFTPYNSTNPNGYVTSSGVTSITLTQGTGISIGSSGTAITTTGSRTISLADNYGDTKNPYASKTARYVLAAPANAAGAPTFRALTNADVGLGNVTNNKQVKGLSSGTTSGHLVTWGSDGYTVADSGVALAPSGNTRGIVSSLASDNDGKIVLTYADGTTSNPIEVKIIGQEGSSVSYADKLNVNGVAVGSTTVPVYFNANGEVQTANTIPKLNNTTTGGVFYAPTSVGSNGQVLKSSGSGAPSWVNQSTLSVGSAAKWTTARTLSLTGDVTGSVSIDGSADKSITTTVGDDSHNHTRSTIISEQTKTYTGVIATANSDPAAFFYFGKILPTSYSQPWKVTYKLYCTIAGVTDSYQVSYVTITGCKNTYYTYRTHNTVPNTSYRPIYYHLFYSAKEAGITGNYGHLLGIGLRYAYNPATVANSRTVKVDILETEDCNVSFFDSMVLYADVPGTGTTNYNARATFDATSQGFTETGDRNDVNYQNREQYGIRTTSAALYRYQICLTKLDGTLVPVNSVNNSVATNKTLTSDSFNPFGEIYWWNSTTTYNAGANVGDSSWYKQYHLVDLRYSFNCGGYDVESTLTARQPLYLVCTPQSDGSAKLYQNPLAQTLPSSEDGLIYIYLGRVYPDTKPYRISLTYNHSIYWYKDGAIRQYAGMATGAITDGAGNTINSTYIKKSVLSEAYDIMYSSASNTPTRLAANTTSTKKFLQMTGTGSIGAAPTWSTVSKSDVGLGSVDNTADANKRVKGANITTTANAIAYYTDTAGTFGTKASANGALYATAANGALSWGTLPVGQGGTGATTFTSDAALIGNGTGAIQTRSITNVTSGAVTASTNLVTANSLVAHVTNAISNASSTYVTLATSQTLTAAATKTYLGLQTYGSNGIAFGTTTNSTVTQKANMKYDSTLEALVFSFS